MWAVRAKERLPRDSFVVEYTGETTELADGEGRWTTEDFNDEYLFEVDTAGCDDLFGRR